jgi:hypothetical protein
MVPFLRTDRVKSPGLLFEGLAKKLPSCGKKISIFFLHDKNDLKYTRSQPKMITTNRYSIDDHRSQRHFVFNQTYLHRFRSQYCFFASQDFCIDMACWVDPKVKLD